jgi:hypothetical protein
MTDADPTRPNYIDGQFLDADDFTCEQLYHLSMLRRHHIAHHTAGTVTGLEIGIDADTGIPYVGPGVGIDIFGRELIVMERLSLGGGLFPTGGPDAYDVVLLYDRVADDGAGATRWTEQPRAAVVAPTGPGAGPPAATAAAAAFGPTDAPPDDPAEQAPLFIGQLRRPDRPGDQPIIDESGRAYVELKASAVTAVEGTARIDLAGDDGPFAIYAGADPSQLSRRLALGADGELTVEEGVTVNGQVTVGGQVGLQPGAAANGWGLQLVSLPEASVSELRVQMGPPTGSQSRRTVIGSSGQSGAFKPLLTIGEDGTVTVSGDMVVSGTVRADGGVVPAELDGQANQYATAALTSGIGASGALLDKLSSGSFNPYTGKTSTGSISAATSQLVSHLSEDTEARVENFVQELKEKGEHLIQPLIDALHRL